MVKVLKHTMTMQISHYGTRITSEDEGKFASGSLSTDLYGNRVTLLETLASYMDGEVRMMLMTSIASEDIVPLDDHIPVSNPTFPAVQLVRCRDQLYFTATRLLSCVVSFENRQLVPCFGLLTSCRPAINGLLWA